MHQFTAEGKKVKNETLISNQKIYRLKNPKQDIIKVNIGQSTIIM